MAFRATDGVEGFFSELDQVDFSGTQANGGKSQKGKGFG
jgi:hypothetical protein